MLPGGRNTILERVWNFETLSAKLVQQPLKYLDESMVSEADKEMVELVNLIDGLSSLDEIAKSFDQWTTHMIVRSIHLLLEHRLVNVQQASLFRPLSGFSTGGRGVPKDNWSGRQQGFAASQSALCFMVNRLRPIVSILTTKGE